jgi:hypothetical protein
VTDNYHIIYDAQSAGRRNFDYKLFSKLTPVLGSYFPETLYRMYLVNASGLIRGLFGMSKAFIHPRTLVKVKVLGTAQNEMRKTFIDENIDPSEIPDWLGGDRTDIPKP